MFRSVNRYVPRGGPTRSTMTANTVARKGNPGPGCSCPMRRRPFPYWHWSGRTERPGGRKPTCPLDTDRAAVARTVGFSRGYLGVGFVPALELHTTVARIRTRLGAREGGGLACEHDRLRRGVDWLARTWLSPWGIAG